MTRVLVGLAGLTLLTFLYLPATPNAQAGTIIAKDSLCGVLDGDGGVAIGNDSVLMMNAGGIAMVKCSVKDVPNSSRRSVHYDYESTGMMCMTAAGATADWHETISASGNATLTCRVKR